MTYICDNIKNDNHCYSGTKSFVSPLAIQLPITKGMQSPKREKERDGVDNMVWSIGRTQQETACLFLP